MKVTKGDFIYQQERPSTEVTYKSGDYVTAIYQDQWWLGLVEEGPDDDLMFLVDFLHPAGSMTSVSYNFPSPNRDKLLIHQSDLLTRVHPSCPTGRSYVMSSGSRIDASNALLRALREQTALA